MQHPVEINLSSPWNYEKFPPIGLDLGTSNSSIAQFVNTNKFKGVSNYNFSSGVQSLYPSAIYFEEIDDDINVVTGKVAFDRRVSHPENVILNIKRKIGESHTFSIGNIQYSPISLQKEVVKGSLLDILKTELENPAGLVVTVPYYFTQHQNHRTRLAVEQAISEVGQLHTTFNTSLLALLPEPIAAGLYHTFELLNSSTNQYILVFDLGGGTLDLTIIKTNINQEKLSFEVLASSGVASMGGADFDELLFEHILEREYIDLESLDERSSKIFKARLFEQIINAKELLSFQKKAPIILNALPNGSSLDSEITRSEFEYLLAGNNIEERNFLNDIRVLLKQVFEQSLLNPRQINTVLMIGGSTQIPAIASVVSSKCPEASIIKNRDYTYHAVSRGAALYAAYLLDQKEKSWHNPFSRERSRVNIQIRTSHNLGIKTQKDRFSIVVPANSIVPVRLTKIYHPTKYSDEDKKIVQLQIELYQGDNELVSQNTFIGEINLEELYTHGRRIEKNELPIEVTFNVSETIVEVNIHAKEATKNKTDLNIIKHIHLEQNL